MDARGCGKNLHVVPLVTEFIHFSFTPYYYPLRIQLRLMTSQTLANLTTHSQPGFWNSWPTRRRRRRWTQNIILAIHSIDYHKWSRTATEVWKRDISRIRSHATIRVDYSAVAGIDPTRDSSFAAGSIPANERWSKAAVVLSKNKKKNRIHVLRVAESPVRSEIIT